MIFVKNTPYCKINSKVLVFCTLIFIFFSIGFANEKTNQINKQITQINKQKQKQNAYIRQTHKTLSTLYNDIIKAQKAQRKVQNKLNIINSQLQNSKRALFRQTSKRDNLLDDIATLRMKTKSLEKQIEDNIATGYSKSLGLKEINEFSIDEVIDEEVYDILLQENKEESYKLNSQYLDIRKKEINANRQTKNLRVNIKNAQAIQRRQLLLVQKQNKIVALLKASQNAYKKKLNKKKSDQNQMQKQLFALNLLKDKEIRKEQTKKQKQKTKNIAKQKAKELRNSTPRQREQIIRQSKQVSQKVNKRGSSVGGVKIAKYRGKKTIAPLSRYIIASKFGKHRDKLYDTEIFEESIGLTPTSRDLRVRSVFRGEVAFVKQNHNLFGNVIIIKHTNSLATVYSQLKQISSSVRKGKKLSRGSVIAISGNVLKFQVLQNGKYVNPKSIFR
jgi:murein DD-endopeptidase MepM/ murein hydrolase activator NlpD